MTAISDIDRLLTDIAIENDAVRRAMARAENAIVRLRLALHAAPSPADKVSIFTGLTDAEIVGQIRHFPDPTPPAPLQTIEPIAREPLSADMAAFVDAVRNGHIEGDVL